MISGLRPDLSFNCDSFEIVWVELDNGNAKNFLIGCIFRHPSSDINILLDYFNLLFPKLTNKQIFLMGDFNIDLLKYHSNTPVKDFVNALLSNNYLPCINHPTRITSQSSTSIDNNFSIIYNVLGTEIISGNILAHISDHFPQILILKDANLHYTKSDAFRYDYSSLCETAFLDDFNHMEFSYIDNSTDVESTYNRFFHKIKFLIERDVPI